MSIWTEFGTVISRLVSGAASSVIEAVRTVLEGDPETRRQVAFSVAMVALSAKMAKADGIVTFDEMAAFHQIFHIPEGEERNVSRLFDLAKQDTAGFQSYATQIERLCGSGNRNCPAMEDILDGLFHIAKADGAFHDAELSFLEATAIAFKIDETHYQTILARHGALGEPDPYMVLGIKRGTNIEEARKVWRELVRENHPDVLTGRGVPEEFITIATERLKTINRAWKTLQAELEPA